MADFVHHDMFALVGEDDTPYRRIDGDWVKPVKVDGQTVLKVDPEGLTELTFQAMRDISHLFRPGHLAQLAAILADKEASANDRFVALELLKNANISAGMVLPSCQDTGTAIVMGKKGQNVWTQGSDEAAIAKGGGSANKSFLFQATPSTLAPGLLSKFLDEKMRTIGTAACPPYHLAIVIGGTSAELNLKTVKLASCKYYDRLPTKGNETGQAWRDLEMEAEILKLSQRTGIGAQFGGKYFCHDVRVIRLPRHGASLPIGMGVSCSADRNALAKVTEDGIFLEQLEIDPAKYLPDGPEEATGEVVKIDLDRPMSDIRATLSKHPIKTRLSLTGTMVVARDAAHAKIRERLQRGEPMPDYFRNNIVYYAGPAKTPKGYASGAFGPTTAGRMDSFVDDFMAKGGSFVSLAKGNRSAQVREACKKHGGFYLGSIGGEGARLAQDCIRKIEVLEYPELGMEAVWRIEVVNFPAFIVMDDKGNDFFAGLTL